MDTTKKIAVMLGLCLMTSISFAGATFHPGDKGNQITTIQQALANYGYDISVDGDYGASTQAAVRQFQEAQGLEADGIVGAATYEALMGEAMPENHTVQAGASAAMPAATSQNEITLVQQALANNGYDVAVDGAFGPGTERAIRSYQVDHGLEPDGIVGQETFYSLTGSPCRPDQSAVSAVAVITGYPGSKVRKRRIFSILPTNISVYLTSLVVLRHPVLTARALRVTSIRRPVSTCRAAPMNSMA